MGLAAGSSNDRFGFCGGPAIARGASSQDSIAWKDPIFPGLAPCAAITRVRFGGVIARVGINYHFTWGAAAPVVARY
jgi:hypothetical protein